LNIFIAYWNLFTFLLGMFLTLFIRFKLPKSWGTQIAILMLLVMAFRSLVYFSFEVNWFPSLFSFFGLCSASYFLLGYGLYLYINWIKEPTKRPDFSWYHWVLPLFTLVSLGIPNLIQGAPLNTPNNFKQGILQMQSWLSVKAYVVLWIVQSGYYLASILIKMKEYPNSEQFKNAVFPVFLIVGSFVSIYLVYTGSVISGLFFGGNVIWVQSSAFFKPLFILGLFLVFYRNPFLLKVPIRLFESVTELSRNTNVWVMDVNKIQILNLPNLRYEDPEFVRQITDKIDVLALAQKPFRDPNFSINELADVVGLPVAHLRFLFKEFNQLSFNDYRNLCRVQDLEEMFRTKDKKHLGLEALGVICGFGSKSAMFRAVRRHFDMTPQELHFRLSSL
jgi:AraC-like DNA-binding protein